MLNLERLCLAFMVFFSRVKIVKRFTAEKKLVRLCIGDMSGLLSGMINGDMKREYKLPLTTISEETNRERESLLSQVVGLLGTHASLSAKRSENDSTIPGGKSGDYKCCFTRLLWGLC